MNGELCYLEFNSTRFFDKNLVELNSELTQ